MQPFDTEFYHESWLAFLYLGLPSSHCVEGGTCRDSLKSGTATKIMNYHEAVVAAQKANTGPAVEPGAKTKQSNQTINHVVTVNMPSNNNAILEAAISALTKSSKSIDESNLLIMQSQISEKKSKIFQIQLLIDDPDAPGWKKLAAQNYLNSIETDLKTLEKRLLDLKGDEDDDL